MKIGLVGYQSSGKSSLFHWLTGEEPDPSHSHTGQTAMAAVPDERFNPLCDIYQPKKTIHASLEIQDTPGLSRKHEGNAQRLALLREAGCLVFVIGAYAGADPAEELQSFDEDLMLADMEIVTKRIARIEDSLKKPVPRSERDTLTFELETLQAVYTALEAGEPLREEDMRKDQRKVTKAFRLLSEKPRLIFINMADDDVEAARFDALGDETTPVLAAPVGLELELASMDHEEEAEFREELGIEAADHDGFIRALMDASGQMLFFTAGEKEVRTWMIAKGTTAVEAAGEIHSDIARGFVRAETMTCSDLIRLGSERDVKAQNLARKEPKDYVIQDGDILLFLHSG
jgi:ribosome-binding ATPase